MTHFAKLVKSKEQISSGNSTKIFFNLRKIFFQDFTSIAYFIDSQAAPVNCLIISFNVKVIITL